MRPEDHRFYKNAVALGAKIQDQISPYVFFFKMIFLLHDFSDTTHLVCFRSGTAKYREAKKKNIKVRSDNVILQSNEIFRLSIRHGCG